VTARVSRRSFLGYWAVAGAPVTAPAFGAAGSSSRAGSSPADIAVSAFEQAVRVRRPPRFLADYGVREFVPR